MRATPWCPASAQTLHSSRHPVDTSRHCLDWTGYLRDWDVRAHGTAKGWTIGQSDRTRHFGETVGTQNRAQREQSRDTDTQGTSTEQDIASRRANKQSRSKQHRRKRATSFISFFVFVFVLVTVAGRERDHVVQPNGVVRSVPSRMHTKPKHTCARTAEPR